MGHLHRAARAGDVDDIRATLAAGADIDAFSVHGFTALMVASQQGCADAARALLAAGARIDLPNPNGRTALSFAAADGRTVVVEALIDAGAAPDPVCRSGDTPLILAARSLQFACVAVLKRARADSNRIGSQGLSADDWLKIGGIRGWLEQKFPESLIWRNDE